jgi:uncharacterized membrane protein YidH (DUF202 family)
MSDQLDDYDDAPSRRRVEPHRGVMILVFGILGFVVCVIFGIIAWVMGKSDLDKMKRGVMDREGETLTKVGYILGMISTILFIVVILFYVVIFMIVLGGAAVNK